MLDNNLDLYKRFENRIKKKMVFQVMKFYAKYCKQMKKCKKLEDQNMLYFMNKDIKNPLYVWQTLRVSLVDWLFGLFCAGNDDSYKNKQNSFIIFKVNLEEIVHNYGSLIQ